MISLFVALSGSAAALSGRGTVRSDDIAQGAVESRNLAHGAVAARNLQGRTVINRKIARETIRSGRLAPDAVTSAKLNPGAVTAGTLRDGAVTNGKLGEQAVTGDKVQAQTLTGENVMDHSLTGEQIDEATLDGLPPGGPAGGALSGSYPNPEIAAGVIADANVAAANKDGAAGTPSLRTLGTGALQAMPGNATPGGPPTGPAGGDLTGTYPDPALAAGAVAPGDFDVIPAARVTFSAAVNTDIPDNFDDETTVVWNEETFDTQDLHSGASPNLTAPIDGVYQVSASVELNNEENANDSVDTTFFLSLETNGVDDLAETQSFTTESSGSEFWDPIDLNATALVALDQGDAVAVDVQQYSGTGRALPLDGGDQSSSFGMVWVGPQTVGP